MVRAIHREGATIIIVEQSLNVALTIADRAYFLEKGEVRFSGSTRDLARRDDIVRSVFLAPAGRRRKQPAAVPKVPASVDASRPALAVDGLRKHFGGITAVNGVSFVVQRGEILGLVGPNGAGKTTVFDLVSGLLSTDEGKIELNGVDVTKWAADRRAKLGLGRSFQDARIFGSLTVTENIAIGLERHLEVRDHFAALLALPAARESEARAFQTVDDLVELMGLGDYRNSFVSELSTGTRRIVDLAMAIAHRPDVLILDEPSSGIAQRETEALAPVLRRIRDETGCALLVIEHDMPLVTDISDRMLALELGAVVTEGPPEVVLRDPRVVASYLGDDMAAINRSGAQGPQGRGARRGKRPAPVG
jgi:branched-chain amino acid transport system ATP-binding protein